MWKIESQRYDQLVWQCKEENKLKSELLDKMNISVRMLCSIKKEKSVTVNGKYVPMHTMVCGTDIIKIELPHESNEYEAQQMGIEVLYEDFDLLVVEKPFGMVVHPTRNHLENTMLNALKYYFDENGIKSKVRFVNRLDRDTSGILIVAKNAYAHSVLTKDTSMWEMHKKYIAVVEGKLDESGTIRLPIIKSEDGIRRMVDENGQECVTHYRTIKSNERASFVELELETGRTHQIRVHMSAIGHPIFGDELYGGNMDFIERQALHCIELGFYSPRLEKEIRVKTKLHDDITELLMKLGLN
ncbi:MAG: RluA family pseudouridine synthase [Proteocatella sp.]|nr:RluA family pseudouridine synthase [Proteocatella sp.]MBP9658616.1 RluA family pseudouridine synthase [Proteocatella sp.]MBP9966738.1 RluA family pseudouridine synthase [Proteocatella sp.]